MSIESLNKVIKRIIKLLNTSLSDLWRESAPEERLPTREQIEMASNRAIGVLGAALGGVFGGGLGAFGMQQAQRPAAYQQHQAFRAQQIQAFRAELELLSRDERFRVIDQGDFIGPLCPPIVYSVERMRHEYDIPGPARASESNLVRFEVVGLGAGPLQYIGDRQAGRAIAHRREQARQVIVAYADGPGCKEWIRGYRDNYDLVRFMYMAGNSKNTGVRLEERRKLTAQHFKGEHFRGEHHTAIWIDEAQNIDPPPPPHQ